MTVLHWQRGGGYYRWRELKIETLSNRSQIGASLFDFEEAQCCKTNSETGTMITALRVVRPIAGPTCTYTDS